jgi:NAD(P)-dependent dehydrogenase (short-subunit alcohol dehydrogenase family)
MKVELSGRVAIVTGSTGGIGLAIAHGLAACGATVVNGRNRTAVDKAMTDMRVGAPEAEVRGVVADLSTATGCSFLIAAEPDSG